jgi:hypothetical protein
MRDQQISDELAAKLGDDILDILNLWSSLCLLCNISKQSLLLRGLYGAIFLQSLYYMLIMLYISIFNI